MDAETAEKMQRRYPDISIADVEEKLKRASIGPKGDRHDYAGAPLSCRESGVVLKELDRLRSELADQTQCADHLEEQLESQKLWIAEMSAAAEFDAAAREVAEADQRLRRHEDAQPRAVGSAEWHEWRDAFDPISRAREEARAKLDAVKGGESG